MTTTITYIGERPHPRVIEIEIGKAWVELERGESIDVPDDLAASLLLQTDKWAGDAPASSPDGTVAEIVAWVDGDPARAAQARDAETAGKARKSLLEQLDEIILAGAADGSDPGSDSTAGTPANLPEEG